MSRDYEDLFESAGPLEISFECDAGGTEPKKAHPDDAGFDLAAPEDVCLEHMTVNILDTRIRVLIPSGFCGLVLPRSSLSTQGIACLTGVIDAGYTGSVKITLLNFGQTACFKKGARLAQLVILPLPEIRLIPGRVSEVKTERGGGGFGSSGR